MTRIIILSLIAFLGLFPLVYGCGGGGGIELAGAPPGDLLVQLSGSVSDNQPAAQNAPDRLLAPAAGYIVKVVNATTGIPYPDAYSVTGIDGKFKLSFKIPKNTDSAAVIVATKETSIFRAFLPLAWSDVTQTIIEGIAGVNVTLSQQSEELMKKVEQTLGLTARSLGLIEGVGKPAAEGNAAAKNVGFLLVAQSLEISGQVIEEGVGPTPTGPATISGKVTNTAGQALAGALVEVSGTNQSATTDVQGNYTIADVSAPGPYYLNVTAPAGYLDGETMESVWLTAGTTRSGVDIKLSARPASDATFAGVEACRSCHQLIGSQYSQLMTSAHWKSIAVDLTRMVETDKTSIWPALNSPGILGTTAAKSPIDGTTDVAAYMCNTSAYGYSMQFIATNDPAAGDCASGTVIKVSGTYGGIGSKDNVGVFKQRFLAKLSDAPLAANWTYDAGKDKDYLILPLQITQSGDGAPKIGVYHANDWTSRKRTFARACANCHNTGMSISWTADGNYHITNYNYLDLNISCERCHGPGSRHILANGGKAKYIINPRYLTVKAANQVCGQCHAADAGKSKDPLGVFSYAYNVSNAGALGGGIYVPGVYDVDDYLNKPTTPVSAGGGFDSWPDGKHGKAHRQQYSELMQSIHVNNPYDKLTCSTCHDVHSLSQGPIGFKVESDSGEYIFSNPKFNDNSVCLACHSTYGPFATVLKEDVAAIIVAAGKSVTKNGVDLTFTTGQTAQAKEMVAEAVVKHMNETAGMGLFVVYDPENEPGVGRCSTCHMPKSAKSGGYTTGLDAFGKTALIEGDQGSHVFDIIPPQTSKAMVSTAGGIDTNIMPNSCNKCHERYRYSAD